jgi:hypothetical protein
MVEREEEAESTERREGVGEEEPEGPDGPYCGRHRGMKCSWLETILPNRI